MSTLAQPFLSANPATACAPDCRQGTQIVPVAGNADRDVAAFVVYHGRGHLDAEGHVTSTPIHLTFAEAKAAEELHAATPRPLQEVLTEHVEKVTARREAAAAVPVGTVVTFREDSPQYAANAGDRYVVTSEPHVDNTHPDDLGRLYVWLELTRDHGRAPSQRRTRSAYVTAIEPAADVDPIEQLLATVSVAVPAARLIRNAPNLAHASKPRRARAACVIGIRGDRFELSQLDGKGHIVEHFTTVTADGAAAFVIGSLR